MKKAKIIGGKDNICPLCGGMMFYLQIGNEIVSQCPSCGCLMEGKIEEKVIIYESLKGDEKKWK